jgi:hypothetical protein
MKHHPDEPLPGFEGEYTYGGGVGHEKAVHHTHFTAPGVKLRKSENDEYEWVEVRPGRFKRYYKERDG